MCACVFLCVCTCTHGGQRSTPDIFLNRSPLFSFFKFLFLLCMRIFICLSMYVDYMPAWCLEGQKKLLEPLELDRQIVVSRNVRAVN